jgi:hypothetical protein
MTAMMIMNNAPCPWKWGLNKIGRNRKLHLLIPRAVKALGANFHYFATILTSFCGTTIIFFTCNPARC